MFRVTGEVYLPDNSAILGTPQILRIRVFVKYHDDHVISVNRVDSQNREDPWSASGNVSFTGPRCQCFG